jgi:uroporphyrinogen-III synthase
MKIAVTKLEEKSKGIPELFKRYGHEAVIVSTMCAAPPTDAKPLTRMAEMASKGELDILIFTSALGAEKLFEKAKPAKNIRIVSVGPKTAKKVEEYGFSSEVIAQFSSGHFAEYLGDIRGKTIGITRAEVPNPELTKSLRSKGARIVEAPAYRLEPAGESIVDALKDADAVIFTSTKSFEFSGFDKEHAKKIEIIAIGKKTADAMRKCGITPDFVGNGTLENCLAQL